MRKLFINQYASLVVVILGSLFSLAVGYFSYTAELERARATFLFNTEQVETQLAERLQSYALVLRGAAGLISVSENVTRQEWQRYTEKLRVNESITQVQGIGFAKFMAAAELGPHQDKTRAEGFPDYQVFPAGERDYYSSVTYLEPFNESNQRAFGYDMYSEPVRREAMQRAARSGRAAVTGKVELVQETDEFRQVGTLMYVAIYKDSALPPRDERMQKLLGWAYSPFWMEDLVDGILHDWTAAEGASIELTIYDGLQANQETQLYGNFARDTEDRKLHRQAVIDFNGTHWLLDFTHKNEKAVIRTENALIFTLGGMLLTFVLTGLLLSVGNARNRAQALAQKLTSDLRERTQQLIETEERWHFAVDATGSGVWDWNIETDEVYYSLGWRHIFGLAQDADAVELSEWKRRIHPEDKAEVFDLIQQHLAGKKSSYEHEYRMQHEAGYWLWVHDRGRVVAYSGDERPLRMIGSVEDISTEKRHRDELTIAAESDKLTGLPNRAYLQRILPEIIRKATNRELKFAVFYIDLDRFKPVNDTVGHEAGDVVLCRVAEKMLAELREHDHLVRVGGDEFVAVVNHIGNGDDILKQLASRLIAAASAPVGFKGDQLQVSATIGIVRFDAEKPRSGPDILRRADEAMYIAKNTERGSFHILD
ncbi:CHASE domain-containing protein [Pseudidiomarina sp. E22-M8]|uniref:CHASE domain-containing protein n=1 Tax=Pseudidiomarina sp. E22-M8 TaxID=3424768 RepID=UPI00403C76B3